MNCFQLTAAAGQRKAREPAVDGRKAAGERKEPAGVPAEKAGLATVDSTAALRVERPGEIRSNLI